MGSIILEPEDRNTAPTIALAAEVASSHHFDDSLLLVLAADHVIQDQKAFADAIQQATQLAEQGKLVTFGIVPQTAHTDYG